MGGRLRGATVLGHTHAVVFSSLSCSYCSVQILIWEAWDVTKTDALKEADVARVWVKVTGP